MSVGDSLITDGLTLVAGGAALDESTFKATAAQKGGDVITAEPQTGLPAVVAGTGSYAIGDEMTVYRRGRFKGPTLTAATWLADADLYWDASAKKITEVAAGNTKIGKAHGAKTAGQVWNEVDLNRAAVA